MSYSPPFDANASKQLPFADHSNKHGSLLLISLCELFERMGYYGSRALLILYVTSQVQDGGLGWSNEIAFSIYGFYTMAIYTLPLPFSFLIDFVTKQKLAVIIGGLVCSLGMVAMAIPNDSMFITGLILNCIGVAFIKPALTVLVAKLFRKRDRDRDAAFIWFYMAINIGAFASGITIAVLGYEYGWSAGFWVAAGCNLIPVIIMTVAYKFIPIVEHEDEGAYKIDQTGRKYLDSNIIAQRSLLAFIVAILTVIFWACFELVGGHLNLASYEISEVTGISETLFQSLNPLYLIVLLPIVAVLYYSLNRSGRSIPSILSFGTGLILLGLGMLVFFPIAANVIDMDTAAGVLMFAYFLHSLGEIAISPLAVSYITRLAPVKFSTVFIAGYFVIAGIGNMIAGRVSSAINERAVEVPVLLAVGIPIVIGIIVIALRPQLERLGHGIS